jgi:UDP:flavonoid glycosyltransferase YjiC (YdhE family)
MVEGHEIAFLSANAFRSRIEATGALFHAFYHAEDVDLYGVTVARPELKGVPGPDRVRLGLERWFVNTIPAQHRGLRQALDEFPADIIIADDMFYGALPTLLEPRSERPPLVYCGTSYLHWCRDDGAPHYAGLPPAKTKAERDEYAAIYRDYDRRLFKPLGDRLNELLQEMGARPISLTPFDALVFRADAYMQLTVPSFEYPREIPSMVHFVGTPPIYPNQAPLPPWANELDGSRKIVLVTQGTVANDNFGLLIGATLEALTNEPDVLVVMTTGGRPVDAIPGPIPDNARVAQFLPFEWILPQTAALVTNGGYGTVNQAISFGVPLVTAGLTQDKAEVNARVAWSGVGIDLRTNQPAPAAVRDAVRRVLNRSEYRARARTIAAEYQALDTRSRIIRIVTDIARSSTAAGTSKVASSAQ